ncbi:MAG: YihA family ribosome biogenesis GTP-binding protein [Clostridia bacterium]|nr:YihA family ribosome biogenesis GTP-binding protein [Clostridia bacterium]MBQ9514314.1 YihA family ribosome biogenesis GTP-binding protein [Clostridia bacterium]
MDIKSATFITSVASSDKFYKTDKPIIAIAGKSNVGKSSLINMLGNNKKLARTSVTPGRTRLINYFDFGDFVLADLPGYGFAKVSKEEKNKWGKLLEDFLLKEDIKLLISLVDIRHDPTEDDKMMINYLYHYQIPFSLVATKSDKLPKTKIKPQLQRIATCLKVGVNDIIAVSSLSGQNKNEILSIIGKAISV